MILPTKVRINSRVVNLVEVHKPETPHLILEDVRRDNTFGLHVISLIEDEPVKLGRG